MISREPLSDANYQFIRELIYKETRINLGDGKRELVTARLGKRLRATSCPTYSDYCKRLKNNLKSSELYHLIDAISTNHTFFFREINHFNYLAEHILPTFVADGIDKSHDFRVWSCACSTGEEPYSVAISLEDYLEKHLGRTWSLECSDISTKVLDFAAKGVYDEEKLQQMPIDKRRKHFQKGEQQMAGYFRINPNLRRKINFQRINLFAPNFPWTRKFHVIFCRNVMIYFDRPTQEDLVGRLAQHLIPGGYLLIGHAESLAGINHPYNALKPAIYQLPH